MMEQHTTSHFKSEEDYQWLAAWVDAELQRSPLSLAKGSFAGTMGESHYYLRAGEPQAPTLVFLAGWLTHPLVYNMGDDLERYPTSWNLVLPEIPGQPGLGILRVPDAAGYRTWLIELLAAVGNARTYLIGESFGAIPLLYYESAIHPGPKSARLFLLAPAGIAGLRKSPQAAFFAVLNRLLSSRRSMDWVMRYVNINPWDCLATDRYLAMRELMYRARAHFVCAASPPKPLLEAELRAIHVPVSLVLAGEDLVYNPSEIRDRWTDLCPGTVDWQLIPDRGHALEVAPEAHDYLIDQIAVDARPVE
jgi:pimeloyl-ACP methyl ester carboxylesterase